MQQLSRAYGRRARNMRLPAQWGRGVGVFDIEEADGKVYVIDDEGNVRVIAAAKEYQLLGSNPLGEPARSTPAIAGGRLYFRTVSHLVSVGNKKR